MKFKVKRLRYNDEFDFMVVIDKSSGVYKLVNLTSKTILINNFQTKDGAAEFLRGINGWEVSVIKE